MLRLLLLLIGSIQIATSAKIIMASVQMGSHILEQVHLAEELVSRGHEVYIAIASRYPKRQDIETRGIKTLQFRIPDDVLYAVSEEYERKITEVIFQNDKNKMAASALLGADAINRDCAYMMDDEQFFNEVRTLNFDLAVIVPFVGAPCNLILPKYLNIPFVSLFVLYPPWKMRVPALPSFVPLLTVWEEPADLTFFARLKNVLLYLGFDIYLSTMAPQNHTLLERFAPELSSWDEILRQSELFLTQCDHHFCIPFPQMPNFISVAGLTTSKTSKQLPESLLKIVEESVDGVILLSFGTSASYFPEQVVMKFLDAFANLSQTVIARFSVLDTRQVPKNVKLLSWLPQNDILAHPNTKLFITHCGSHGQHEALYHGVPMLGFPLFAEQHMNCYRAYKKGFGLQMRIQDFTSAELLRNVQEILKNPKYRSTIRKASEIFRDQPMHPREKAAFWVEHVIRHGGKHLRTLAMDMPLYEFLMLDIIGVIVLTVFVFLIISRFLLKRIWNVCFGGHRKPNLKMKSS